MDYRSNRYPDLYYGGEGRGFMTDNPYQDTSLPRKAPDFENYQGYDRRKIPKPQLRYPRGVELEPETPPLGRGYRPPPRGYPPDDRYPSLPRSDLDRGRYERRADRDYLPRRDRSRSSERDYRRDPRDRDYFQPPYGAPSRSSWSERGRPYDRNGKYPPVDPGGIGWPGDHFDSYPPSRHRDKRELINGRHGHGPRRRRIPKSPTRFLFLLLGILLMAVGIAKAIMAIWNHYYTAISTGFLIAALGVVGLIHKKDYTTSWKNLTYISLGTWATIAMCISSALHIGTIVEVIKAMALGYGVDQLFSNANSSHQLLNLTRTTHFAFAMETQTRIYVSLGLDVAALLLILTGSYVMTAVGRLASYYLDEKYDTYGECNPSPHKRPLLFNPFDQMSLGQACIILGFVAEFITLRPQTTYWSPVWTGLLVVIAGVVSFIADKWPHKLALGIAALVLQFLAFLASVAGIALCTLALYNDIRAFGTIPTNDWRSRGLRAASIAGFLLADTVLVANLLFIVGRVVRNLWRLCCRRRRS